MRTRKRLLWVGVVVLLVAISGPIIRYQWRLEALHRATLIPALEQDPDNRAAYYFEALRAFTPPHDSWYDTIYATREYGEDAVARAQGVPDKAITEALDALAKKGVPWDDSLGWIEPFLHANENTLQILQAAMALEDCTMPVIYNRFPDKELPGDTFPLLERFQHLGLLLVCTASHNLWQGEQTDAIHLGVLLVQMGRDVASAGPDVQTSTGIYLAGLGCRVLSLAVTSGPLNEECLSMIEQKLAAAEFPVPLREELSKRHHDWLVLVRAEHGSSHYLEAFGLSWLLPNFPQMGYSVESDDSYEIAEVYSMAEQFPWFDGFRALNGSLRLIRTGAAIQRFVKDKGRLPQDLKELAPGYLKSIPEDPVTGAALSSESDQDTLRIGIGRSNYIGGRHLTFYADRLIGKSS